MSNAYQYKLPCYTYVTVEAPDKESADAIIDTLCIKDIEIDEEVDAGVTATLVEVAISALPEYLGPC